MTPIIVVTRLALSDAHELELLLTSTPNRTDIEAFFKSGGRASTPTYAFFHDARMRRADYVARTAERAMSFAVLDVTAVQAKAIYDALAQTGVGVDVWWSEPPFRELVRRVLKEPDND